MRIVLERYYGDSRVTKSVMKVFEERGAECSDDLECSGSSGKLLLACEGREPCFADYSEIFPGCSRCCLAVGVYRCKVVSTDLSPMTLMVIKSPGHRCYRIAWDYTAQVRHNMVLVGESDGYEDPEWREIVRSRETFERLTRLVYQAYGTGEEIWLEVVNRIEEFSDKENSCCNAIV